MFKKSLSALLFALLMVVSSKTFSDDSLVFIVNVANPVSTISQTELNDYFFKRKRTWPDGKTIRFIDRKASPERTEFFKKFLKKTEEEVDRFWIAQKLNSGDSAPIQSQSDSMSIQFVSAFPGAIGYLTGNIEIRNKNVKVIKIKE